MYIKIDFDSEEPIYQQIRNEIIRGIARGELSEGDELPSVRGMAEDIGVNMHTVNKSYALLKDDGYLKMDRRKGAVISISLEQSHDKFKTKVAKEMDLIIAECYNRNISEEDLIRSIKDGFKKYNSMNYEERD